LRQKPRKVKILHFEIIKFENEFVSQAILQIHTKNALFIRINSLIIPVSKGNEKMKITLNESLIQGTLLINAIGLFNNENRIENIQLKKISIKKSKINILEIKPIVPSSNISLITTFKRRQAALLRGGASRPVTHRHSLALTTTKIRPSPSPTQP
jgi:hypothetical protein